MKETWTRTLTETKAPIETKVGLLNWEEEESEIMKRPDGRRKMIKKLFATHLHTKLKIAEKAVKFQQQPMNEIVRRKEIMLIMNGPDRADSEMVREYFSPK